MRFRFINSSRDFIFEKEKVNIFELNFPKWYSHRAEVSYNKSNIEIKPKSIWSNKYYIFKNSQEKGLINSNWKGEVSIQFYDQRNNKHVYKLMKRGFWKEIFEVYNEKMALITTVVKSLNWKKLNSNYELENKAHKLEEKHFNELMIYIGFYLVLNKKNAANASASYG